MGGLGKAALFGGLGAATVAVGGLSSALISGIGDARDAGLVFAQTEAVIKSTGGAAGFTAEQISDMAASYSLAEGKSMFGDDDIQKGQNLLLTFTNIKEQLPAATGVMVDMATAMGTDVSGGAIQLGKALNDPIKGISALSRVGVTFTDQQKQQIKVMQESGDMAGAQGIILAELNKEFGGSAQAAAAAAGPMVMFKERMGELAESVGAQALPLLDKFGAWLTSPEIMGGIEAGIGAAVNFITTTVIPALTTGFTFLTTNVFPLFQAAFTAIWPVIQQAVNTVYVFLSTVVWPWLQTVAFPWLTTAALPALQLAWQTAWTAIQAAVNIVWAWLQTTVWPWLQVTFFPLMTSLMTTVQTAWSTAWPAIQTAVQTAWTWISTVAWPWLRDEFFPNGRDMMVQLKDEWNRAWPVIQAAVQTAYDFIMGTVWPWLRDEFFPNLQAGINEVKEGWSVAWPAIQGAVTTVYEFITGTVWPFLRDTLFPLMISLMADVQAGWEVAWSAIDTAVSTVYTWISGIAWPWFRDEFMGNLKTGIDEVKQGWEVAWPLISSAVDTVYLFFKDTVLPGIQGVLTDLETGVNTLQSGWDTAFALMKGYVDDLKTGWDTLKSGVTTAIDTIKGAIDGLKDKLRSIKDAIPDILIPGSPTPFEMGLRGIADAARTLGPALGHAFGMIGSTGIPSIELATTLSRLLEATAGGELGKEAGKKLAGGLLGGVLDELKRIGQAKLIGGAEMIRDYLERHGSPVIGQAGAHAAQTYAAQFRAWLEQNGLGALPGLGSGTGVVTGTPGGGAGGIGGTGGGLPNLGTPGSKTPTAAATINNFSMTIHTSAPYEPIVRDYHQMAATVRRG